MKDLERTRVGEFEIKDSHTIQEDLQKYVISMEEILKENDSITLSTKNIKQYLNGVLINIDKPDGVYKVYFENFIGTGIVKNKLLKRDIVI